MIPLMTSGIIRFDIGAGDLVDIMFEVLQDYLPDFIESVKRRVSLAETMTVPTQDI